MATDEDSVQRLQTAWRYATGAAREAFGREVMRELMGPRAAGRGEIVVSTLVSSTSGEPVVSLAWGREAGQMTPAEARAHALTVLEAASAAEADAFLMRFKPECHKPSDPPCRAGRVLCGVGDGGRA